MVVRLQHFFVAQCQTLTRLKFPKLCKWVLSGTVWVGCWGAVMVYRTDVVLGPLSIHQSLKQKDPPVAKAKDPCTSR